jgi:glycosyltransferase involved in cell wall biosynthesis
MPKLSIIIPTFNSGAYIEGCLRSVASQTFRDYEVIVQDGCSSDDTVERIGSFRSGNPGIDIKLAIEKDRGPYDAMNKGVSRATGEWLYFLGSDDQLHDRNVLAAIFGTSGLAGANVIYGNVRVIGSSDWARANPVYGGTFDVERLLHENICHQAIFYRAAFFREVGEYNVEYLIYADWDFNMRCWSRTKFRYLEVTVAIYSAAGLSGSGCDECFRKDVASNVLTYFNLSLDDRLVNGPTFVGFAGIMVLKESRGAPRSRGASAEPSVSVVVPNYNHARFLKRRIESVLRQTYQDFEMILLDDCSTDESREILAQYADDARVRIELNEANSGSTFKQWNKGVGMARGKYVWIAESDDFADERLLERLVGLLEKDERVVYAYCRSWSVAEDDRLLNMTEPEVDARDLARWSEDYCAEGREECRLYFARNNVVANASAVVFRKAVYDAVGGADESLKLCGDWKLWAGMALRGMVAYVSEPLNYYRYHSASVRAKSARGALSLYESVHVMRWVVEQVPEARATVEGLRPYMARVGVPALMSSHVSRETKRRLYRELRAMDALSLGQVIGPVFEAIGLKIRRHWRGWMAHAGATRQAGGASK